MGTTSQLESYVFAADQEQAGISLSILKGMIQANPDLSSSFQITKNEIKVKATNSFVRIMSSDAPSSFGLGGIGKSILFVLDEFWAWKNPDLWTSISSATGKLGSSWRVIILSNAGIEGESKVAWQVREACRLNDDFYFWRSDGPVAGWITPIWLDQQRRLLTPDSYRRLIDNEWTSGSSDFISGSDWDALIDTTYAPMPESTKSKVFCAVDASKGARPGADMTALVAIRKEESGHLRLVYHKIWAPRTDGRDLDMRETVLPALKQLKARYSIAGVWYDPYQFSLPATIGREMGLPMKEFGQTSGNLTLAAMALLDAIRSKSLRVYDGAGDLREHVLNAVLSESSRGVKLDKSKSSRKIDGAAALSTAIYACQQEPVRGSFSIRFGGESISDEEWAELENPVKRSMSFVQVETQPDTHLIRNISHCSHQYYSHELRRDFMIGAGAEAWVPQAIATLLTEAHPQKLQLVQVREVSEICR